MAAYPCKTEMTDPPNAQIASMFDELADLYELDGAVIHRVLAYRNAAKAAREASTPVAGGGDGARRPGHRAAGYRQDARGEDPRARRDRDDSRGREAAGEVPAGPRRHDP